MKLLMCDWLAIMYFFVLVRSLNTKNTKTKNGNSNNEDNNCYYYCFILRTMYTFSSHSSLHFTFFRVSIILVYVNKDNTRKGERKLIRITKKDFLEKRTFEEESTILKYLTTCCPQSPFQPFGCLTVTSTCLYTTKLLPDTLHLSLLHGFSRERTLYTLTLCNAREYLLLRE